RAGRARASRTPPARPATSESIAIRSRPSGLWYARSLIHQRIQPRMKREDFTFVHSLRVRWAEVDRQDVVFNGHYFLYFDVAVAEYWRAIGFRYPEDIVEKFGTDIYAVKASAEYHGSSTYDELIDIGCRVGRIDRKSTRLNSSHVSISYAVFCLKR